MIYIPVNHLSKFTFLVFVLTFACLIDSWAQEKKHIIKSGETLSSIAKKYRTTIADLEKANPETAKGIRAGAEIVIPEGKSENTKVIQAIKPAEVASSDEGNKHKVAAGESLFKIAKKYNVSVKDLEKWNRLTNAGLKSGEEIWVSAPTVTEPDNTGTKPEIRKPEVAGSKKNPLTDSDPSLNQKTHIVVKGQTLSAIAKINGTTVDEIKKLNKLKSNQVNLGQELIVPGKAEQEISASKPVIPVKPTPAEAVKEEPEESKMKVPEKVKVAVANVTQTPSTLKEIPEKEEVKMSSGIREVNNSLGYTRVVETGFAEAIEGDGNSKKHLCLHKSAPVGSILQVKNEMNGQSVFVKVIGKLPETGSNEKLVIRISRQAYDRLLAVGKRFPVEVSYPQAEQ